MFLPRISPTTWILALTLASCGPGPAPTATAMPVAVRVVPATGDVPETALARIEAEVAASLPVLQGTFDDLDLQPFVVFVHGARESMPEALQAALHEDSPGFAILGRHQIHLVWGEIRRTGADPRGVVAHELVHELLDQYVAPDGSHVPRWFHEGLAQLLAGDTYLGAREEDLVWRVGARRLASFGSLRDEFPRESSALRAAYAQSYSYVAWLERRYGLPLLLRVARSADELTSFERALVARTGRTTLELEDGWREHLLHGSGATWRVLSEQWFGLLMIAALPVLVLALSRRLGSEQRAARRLAERARADRAAAEAAAAAERAAAEAAAAESHDGPGGERDEAGRFG